MDITRKQALRRSEELRGVAVKPLRQPSTFQQVMTDKEVIMKSQTTNQHAGVIAFASEKFCNATEIVPSHPDRRAAAFACTLLAVALCLGGNATAQQSSAAASQSGQAAG